MSRTAVIACLTFPVMGLSLVEQPLQNPSAQYHSPAGRPVPMVELPARVPAPEGKLTLWADFDSDDSKGVPLYLVNRTNEDHSLDSQDHDLFIKLEYRDDKSGSWRRAQAHISSWCGNSYYPVSLPAQQFFTFHGYKAANGEKVSVRYAKQDGTLVSNEGKGLVLKTDLEAVANDALTAQEVPFGFSSLLEYEKDPTATSRTRLSQRANAVRALRWYPRNEPVRRAVLKLQAAVIQEPEIPERKDLLAAIDDYLARLDEPKPDVVELNRICIARIQGDTETGKSMPEETAWALLKVPSRGDVLARSFSDPEIWRPLIAPAVARIKEHTKQSGIGNEHMILSTGWIIDAVVRNAEIETWVADGPPNLREIGATALVRRSSIERLVELAWKLPPEEQLRVLKVLAMPAGRGSSRQPDFGNGEDRFWTHCASSMPSETAAALFSYEFVNGNNPYNRLIHDPLHEFFKKEASVGRQEKLLSQQNDSRLSTALLMLASWKLEEDDSLMKELLEHGGYTIQKTWVGGYRGEVVTKRYTIRLAAKQALLKRGVPLPPNVVIEKEMPPTPKK